jgi:hypothetical protein
MDGESTTKQMNRYPIQKKLSTFNNIFYYVKFLCDILDSKVYDFKQNTRISADEYDIMYVMTKKIKEALIDAYNEHNKFKEKNEKL